jgi:group II intron reverse transcriptase/maturase/CRISPR-associated endonuclease Cas1
LKKELFKKITDIRTLWKAWQKVKEKNTARGIDNISIDTFEKNLDANLKSLRLELENETYIPEPLTRIPIPKDSSREKRFIGIPCVKDKVVQNAFKLVVEPVFEKSFLECSYGYRPGRGPHGAVRKVDKKLNEGHNWILNLDIDNFFDSINHKLLISLLSEKVNEIPVIRLIELWINMGMIADSEWLEPTQGVPQGNVLSPLLSNIYLHPFDQEMTCKGLTYIRYADDFIVMCRTKEDAVQAFKDVASFLKNHLHLQLNPDDNPIKNIDEGFVFLGFHFKNRRKIISGQKLQHIQNRIKQILTSFPNVEPEKTLTLLNEAIAGWRQYYSLGDVNQQFQFLDNILFYNLSSFLKKCSLGKWDKSNIDTLRTILHRQEFFLEKSTAEKKRLIELLIAHSRIQHEKITVKNKPAAKQDKTPIPVTEAVAKKKKEYETIILKGTDLVVSEKGAFIGKNGRWLLVKRKGEEILKMPLMRLKNIIILSKSVVISSHIIKYCCDKHLCFQLLDPKGKSYAHIHSPYFSTITTGTITKAPCQNSRYLALKSALVKRKILNQMNLLRLYRDFNVIELEFKEQCESSLLKMKQIVEKLEKLSLDEENEKDAEEKMRKIITLEKIGAAYYWKAFKSLLSRFAYFERRESYGSTDIVNGLLNFGYALLNAKIYQEVLLTGRNYNIIILYKGKVVNQTLVSDLSGLFRQPVIDCTVVKMIREIEKVELVRTILTMETRKKLTEAVLRKLNSHIDWKDKQKSYCEIIRNQAESIIEFKDNGTPFEPFIFQQQPSRTGGDNK